MIICNLLLVNPAASATPEKSFSMARWIKTWLRSAMTQSCFNSLAILPCHTEGTDNLDLAAVAIKFKSSEGSPRKVSFSFEIMINNLTRTKISCFNQHDINCFRQKRTLNLARLLSLVFNLSIQKYRLRAGKLVFIMCRPKILVCG